MTSGDVRNRLHGFDNVRGLAAVAVVALHAAYAHALHPLPGLVWPVPLDQASRVADAVFWWFEGSIMPLFFVLSGYFLARSLARESPGAVFVSRTRRLLLPMSTVGFAVLAIDLHVWVLGLIASDRATIKDYRRLKFAPEIQAELFGPAHLWYVEYLWLMCAAVCGAAWLIAPILPAGRFSATFTAKPGRLALGGMVVAVAVAAVLLSYDPYVVLGFQHGWLPDPPKFAHGLICLLLGALLARSPALLNATQRYSGLLLAGAAGLFCLLLPRIRQTLEAGLTTELDPTLGLLLAAFAVTATFGQLGAGLRWLDGRNEILARLAEASFWIYVVHHPVLGLLQIALRPIDMPPLAKCGLVLAVTLIVCLVSYRWLVKDGPVGRLLAGELPWRALRRRDDVAVDVRANASVRNAA